MPTEKKLTKEDTWKPAELTKHMRDAGHGDRRREERERRAGDNTKEEERESRRARDNKDEERERRRSRDPREERHVERKREGAEEREKERRRREGGAERDKERRREGGEEREKERRREGGAEREKERREGGEEREKERRREGEEREKERRRERDADTRGPDRDPQRHREGERERHKDRARERDIGDEKEKRREEREGHRRREGGREREGEEREKHKERERREEGDRRHDERPDKARRVRRSEEEKEEEKNKEPRRDGDRRRRKQEDGERGKEEEEERERRRREKEARRREKEEEGGGRDEERERRHRERRQRQVGDVGGGVSTELREPEETKARHHHGDQDAGEKERRRARRHPVLPEAAAGADVPPAASERKAAAEPESAHGEPAYEDDFEEYEEDFEELDESGEEEQEDEEKEEEVVVVESPRQKMGAERRKEVEAIQRAMEEENRRAAGGRSAAEEEIRPRESEHTRPGSPRRGSPRGPRRGKFIDFVAAKQREINQKVASKQKKRSTELLRLVELDFSPTFSLLDLPPLSQYDVYIKSFGNTNTKQAYVQCREDDGERDVQTDLIEVLDRWTQHPADHTGACGEPGRSQDAPDGNTAQINIDSQRLATFLHSAVQVMSVLLEEDHAERRSLRTTGSQTDALSFSEGNLQLNTQLPFLHGRPCSLLLFSASQRQTLLSVHGPLAQPGAVRLDSWTLLCVWSMWEPSRPQKVLVYESEVRCCCFSPGRGALVLAGTSDGALVLWDLREPAGGHHTMTIAGTEWTFRQPTFSTDAVLSALGHHSAVNTIAVLPSPSSTTTSTSSTAAEPQPPLLASEESAGTSFQLASLDERGVLNLWVVLELTSASLAGSQTDLGLRPGGKVKLLHSSCMPAVEREGADLEALQLHFLPSDANHFLITTNMGVVHHGTVHGFRSPPRDYGSQEGGSRPLNVTSLHFSPFNPQLFLVGCSDGSMRLHIVSSHWPLAEWTTCRGGGAPEVGVVSVRWSQSRPAVFCVLDSASYLHLWDLSRDALGPVATETLHADGVTAMAVFGSASSASSSSSNQSSFSGVALAHRTGKLQLHYFNPSFSSANHVEDEGVLQSMMHQAL